jgi:hypothetical protein
MADYYPLIARAVAGLDKNTGDARRGLYERARTALVAQLRSPEAALNESDITRERLALEEAIRKVEAECARKARAEPARAEPGSKVRAPDASRWEAAGRWDVPAQSPLADLPAPQPRKAPPLLWPEPAPARPAEPVPDPAQSAEAQHFDPVADQPAEQAPPEPELPLPPPPRSTARLPSSGDGRSLLDSGLSNFRDVVSETDELGEASAQAVRSARESFAAVPGPPAAYDYPDERTRAPHAPADDGQRPQMLEPSFTADEPRAAWPKMQAPQRAPDESDADARPAPRTRSYRELMRVAVSLVVVACVAGLVAWQWPAIALLYRWARTPGVVEAPKEAPPTTRPKIADRLDPGGQPAPTQPPPGTSPGVAPGTAVAQRVVLYEEDPAEPQGKRFVGSAIWRTETVSPGPGRSPELAVRADIEIPERKISMTWSLRRNTDQSLPASHTVEIMFKLPADFSSGSISNVPGILMKQTEQTRGVPLAGLAVKVTNGFFLIGLSSVDTDRERNVQLLKERAWFDIPVVYTNNRRAILALEKGTPGERAFADAFKAWGQ